MLVDSTASLSREHDVPTQSSYSEQPLPVLRPCTYQVAGHLPENGKNGSLIDDYGRFYKPLQPGCRGKNELNFYRKITSLEFRDNADEDDQRKLELLKFVPQFFGSLTLPDNTVYLILEDVVCNYRRPCVMDIKIGYRTWYSAGDQMYNARAKKKDDMTTQSTMGFKICGWQVYDVSKRKFHRMTKSKCKTLSPSEGVEALRRFANNNSGVVTPDVLYQGSHGAVGQLRRMRNWFQTQSLFKFYSSSILIIYEGDEQQSIDALNVQVRLVDFAHTFTAEGVKDRNFLDGLQSLIDQLNGMTTDTDTSRRHV